MNPVPSMVLMAAMAGMMGQNPGSWTTKHEYKKQKTKRDKGKRKMVKASKKANRK